MNRGNGSSLASRQRYGFFVWNANRAIINFLCDGGRVDVPLIPVAVVFLYKEIIFRMAMGMVIIC